MKLALVQNLLDDQWPSMKVVSQNLYSSINSLPDCIIQADLIPASSHKLLELSRIQIAGPVSRKINHYEKIVRMHMCYPYYIQKATQQYDAILICDNAYAHLANSLPAECVAIFCHDASFYKPVLDRSCSLISRYLINKVARGLRRARVVFYPTESVRADLLSANLVDPNRLHKAVYGISPTYTNKSNEDALTKLKFQALSGRKYILHVGSCVPRKRMDILLRSFYHVRNIDPELLLVKAGQPWETAQQQMINDLQIGERILTFHDLTNSELAHLYRNALVVMMPSDFEGFGLPVAEAALL
jgi:glycosyltransferase involved in cell wall biosynthesis